MRVTSASAPSYSDEELRELRDTLQNVGVEYVMATYADGHGIAKCKTRSDRSLRRDDARLGVVHGRSA